MTFITVKKGARPSSIQVYISAKAKTATFSAGFLRNFGLEKMRYIKIAYSPDSKEIALEFSENQENKSEYLKLSFTEHKTNAACSINPILTTFSIKATKIAGIYKDLAMSGPAKIFGFSDHGFILKAKYREV